MPKKYKNIFPMEIFIRQIKKIMAEKGIGSGAAFDRQAGLRNKAARWFNPDYRGESVEVDTLLTIAKSFNKSIDWLLFGQEPIQNLQEFASESYEARPLAPIEAELLNEVSIKVEEVLQDEKRQLPPEQKARLLTRVYNDCAEDRIKPDAIMVKRYLWILK